MLTVKEANAILDSISENNKTSWEQIRWLAYIQAVAAGADLKTPLDLVKFSWDESKNTVNPTQDKRTKEEIVNSLLEIKNSFV